ncbi:MAG: hypothetical protein AAGJ31_05260, partial [Verrucomicrobiota bacterium]
RIPYPAALLTSAAFLFLSSQAHAQREDGGARPFNRLWAERIPATTPPVPPPPRAISKKNREAWGYELPEGRFGPRANGKNYVAYGYEKLEDGTLVYRRKAKFVTPMTRVKADPGVVPNAPAKK